MFDTSKLLLEQMIFEVRFEHAFLYWDNSGKIFSEILKGWPTATVETVALEGAKMIIKVKDEDLTVTFSPQQINFNQSFPGGIKAMGEFADYALPIISRHLDVHLFTRIGNRFIYVNKVDNVQASIALLEKTGFFSIPEDKFKKIGTSLNNPGVKFTAVRDNDVDYTFNMAHVSRKLEIKVPKPIKYDASAFITDGLLVDIDFHTLKPVEGGNIRVHELLKKNKKDIEYLIGELLS